MGISFDVQVLDDDENPVEGKRVHVNFPGFLGATWLEEFTDEDGHASFETASDDHNTVNIQVGGEWFGPYDLEDGMGYTVTI